MKETIICIDPGHGGHDPGAIGPNGLTEASVVLIVGKALRNKLNAMGIPGLRVMMTRDTDVFVPLTERAAIANRAGATLFLSIHCNSAERPAMGIETWIARQTTVSLPLAERLQDSLTHEFPDTSDRGIKRANFVVIAKTEMAAALVELEFIHTACGEERLRDNAIQLRYAEALKEALLVHLGLIKAPIVVDPAEAKSHPASHGWDAVRMVADRLNELANKHQA